jgi:phage terminase large subunit
MEIDVNIDPDVFNLVYYPLLFSQVPVQIIYGGSSAGKSLFIIGQRMIIDLMVGGRNYLCCRNVKRTIRHSIFNEAEKGINRMGVRHLFNINKTDMTITCANGYQAIMTGLDDPEKVKSITPAKGVITDILLEEATEISRDALKQLRRRLRGLTGGLVKRVVLLFNPIFRTHWIYEAFFADKWHKGRRFYKDDDLLILKTTYKDNMRFLTADDVKLLEEEGDEYYRDVYTLGEWGVLGDLVFTNWEVQDLSGIKGKIAGHKNGLDFGFTNNPTALSRIFINHGTMQLFVLDEFYERGMTNRAIAEKLKNYIGQEVVYCDSAEPKSIAELVEYEIQALPAIKGPGSINQGIQYLKQFKIIIDRECQNHINEISQYHWMKDKEGNATNTPVKKRDHCMDALRYANSYDYMKDEGEEVHSASEIGVF